jgi:hypothetical protein
LQENRDRFFSRLFQEAQKHQISIRTMEILRTDLLESILQESHAWEKRDFDPDLKVASICLTVDLCTYKGHDDHGEQGMAMKMIISSNRLCPALKNYIMSRIKSEQVLTFYIDNLRLSF